MIIEPIQKDLKAKFQLSLEKLTQSYSKRGVSFVITAESEYVGSIIILVTGKLGTVQKTIIVIYNQKTEEWEAYSEGYCFKMLTLSDISSVIKTKITKLSNLLTKI